MMVQGLNLCVSPRPIPYRHAVTACRPLKMASYCDCKDDASEALALPGLALVRSHQCEFRNKKFSPSGSFRPIIHASLS